MSGSPQSRRSLLLLLLGIALLGSTGSVLAQGTCSSGTPARSVHHDLWGSAWMPGDRSGAAGEAPLPNERDSTDYTGNNLPTASRPLYTSLDIEGGYAFTTYATGFKIWNIAGGNAEVPASVTSVDMHSGSTCLNASGFFVETPICNELKEFLWDIDAPPGKPGIIAMAGLYPVGLTIVKTNAGLPLVPVLLYQDTGKQASSSGSQVYAATLGSRDYAFYGANSGRLGLYLYDMTAASSLDRCAENTDAGTSCPGVYKGRIGPDVRVTYVDGVSTASGRHYVAASSGSAADASDRGFRIWDVTSPTSPVNVSNTMDGRFLSTAVVFGVAMWEQASKQYLALHLDGGARIYDVTSCLANRCPALPNPIWSGNWNQYGQDALGAERRYVTFSRSGTRPMLYFGSLDQCSGGRQREFIFDVSNAGSPVEVSSDATMVIEGKTIDYWGWYYSGNYSGNSPKHGFSRVAPMVAKFNGPNLYRAARTVFDVHVWTGGVSVPPVAGFTWSPPTGIYAGDAVQFTDTSGGSPTSWNWTFSGASAAATSESPAPESGGETSPP
ncbi:MAG TPA: hypothetical protein VN493_30315 [Thermoanaerobaculia bacterium]|nr:hypothetical protein [Thermoanaerobaculia bacterium]